MNPRLLRLSPVYLVRVVAFADLLSPELAGRACAIDAANIYRALNLAEDALGIRLFKRGSGSRRVRGGRPPELTEKGIAIIAQMRDILALYSSLPEIAKKPDDEFSTASGRAAVRREIAALAQPAAGGRH